MKFKIRKTHSMYYKNHSRLFHKLTITTIIKVKNLKWVESGLHGEVDGTEVQTVGFGIGPYEFYWRYPY